MRKSLFALLLCGIVCLTACWAGGTGPREVMGFEKAHYRVVEEEDTHGGFHGDGCYYLILDCSSDPDTALDIARDWSPLPLSENLNLIMYGGERGGITYMYSFAEEAHWPMIEHGYYRFRDDQAKDPADDSGLLTRYSFNFEIAAYDTDSNMLYFFRMDT